MLRLLNFLHEKVVFDSVLTGVYVGIMFHRKPIFAQNLGFCSRAARSSLAYANQHRDWRVFAAMAQWLMPPAQALYQNEAAPQSEWPAVV